MPVTYKPFHNLARKVYTEPAKKAFQKMFPTSIAGKELGYTPPVSGVRINAAGNKATIFAAIGDGVNIQFNMPLDAVCRF